MNVLDAFLWGGVATVVLTTVLGMAQGLRLSRMALPFMVGTVFTSHRSRAMVIGMAVHGGIGLLFAFGYASLFESLGRATWWSGLILGALHGLFMLAVFTPLLPYLHPRMASERQGPTPTRLLQPPGFLALNYGWRTTAVVMVAHLSYGAIMGGFYRLATR